ncbi:hypothetical protein SLS58_007769 [Diplodia intermedia]|uniref:Heterokaryon incompatibility domain-containing protein n=1 Tax=Diplodia intermedia TaxID=856260 RepID=A0ABR3TJ67_9PEZI
MQEIGTITNPERNFRIDSWDDDDGCEAALRDRLWEIERLFRCPEVWQRVWIMQEVSYAPRVALVDDQGGELPWERVDAFFDVDKYIAMSGFPNALHNAFGHHFVLKTSLNRTMACVQILAHQRRLTIKMLQQQQRQQDDDDDDGETPHPDKPSPPSSPASATPKPATRAPWSSPSSA